MQVVIVLIIKIMHESTIYTNSLYFAFNLLIKLSMLFMFAYIQDSKM